MSTLPATEAVVETLAKAMRDNMPSIQNVYNHWPDPQEHLIYPSASIHTRQPTFRGLPPYLLKIDVESAEAVSAETKRVVGMYDFNLQVDLWASYKPQRETLAKEFNQLFYSPNKTGLDLQLIDYFDEWASYSLGAEIQYIDGEMAAQRNEWRIKATVQCSCYAVAEFMESLMKNIEKDFEIAEEPLEDSSGQGYIALIK